ncbi:putative bifunctional diguanylate cyclase/phosphodiesterase [Cribrihabitans neustonicus]|uniref:putative bifunctional diguanylate cyclase/phosphodiesterase n=1 Tax=Cribrihabitans neustonicus TaxID=1429085 RepID=UPI003B591678
MYRVIDCLTNEHSLALVGAAAVVCIIGSWLSVQLGQRLLDAQGRRRLVQLGLNSLIAGATIWSTHFIAMLAYEPGYPDGYEPVATGLSLGVAVIGMALANSILGFAPRRIAGGLAGAVFGLSVSAMHYTGMSAYLLPGKILWSPGLLAASVLLGLLLGAASWLCLPIPGLRYRRVKAAALMVAAICAMHFTGMSAIRIELSPAVSVPAQVISDATLAMLIFAVMGLILLVGFAATSIEENLENEARGQLRHAALHDPLTGMKNRMWLNRKLAELTPRLERGGSEAVALLTIDLNLFKEVNDLYGHAVGDEVLKTAASRIGAALERDEFAARAGGDEFVAMKRGFRHIEEVAAFAERLHAAIIEPVDLEDASVRVGAAIGAATSLHDGTVPRDLLHKSDLAMYRAKTDDEHHICFYNEDMDRQSRDKLLLIHDLRQACAEDQFELVYQLQNDLTSLEPVGFEVLLRWNHPERGLIGPDEFIPVAEETGLIREIGHWVLRTACREAASWPRSYSVAVNVAPQQLVQPSFIEMVMDILMETGLAPERLELEITEASIIDDQTHTLRVMHKLKSLGIRIAMDDFGTGYSSLAMLQTFPFDKIKIDRSFVQDVHKDEQRAAIVRSTLLLGAALNIPVLAEGVEVQDELDFLRTEKCNSVQGFYFGKPMSRAEMLQLIARHIPEDVPDTGPDTFRSAVS